MRVHITSTRGFESAAAIASWAIAVTLEGGGGCGEAGADVEDLDEYGLKGRFEGWEGGGKETC